MAVSVGTSPESLRESLTFSWTSFSSLGGRSRWMQESDLGSDKARWEGEPKVLAGEIKQRYPASSRMPAPEDKASPGLVV